MAQFNSTTAPLKHNHGMTKGDVEQGFERLDSYADDAVHAYTTRNPSNQGWRGARAIDDEFGVEMYEPGND